MQDKMPADNKYRKCRNRKERYNKKEKKNKTRKKKQVNY